MQNDTKKHEVSKFEYFSVGMLAVNFQLKSTKQCRNVGVPIKYCMYHIGYI